MYYVYIVECADKSLYTGITTDLSRRIEEHNSSAKGAKYTSARRPVKVVYWENHKNRSVASKTEAQIKKLTRKQKLALIDTKKLKNISHKELQKDLYALKNPAKAKVLAGFFKTGKGQYGEGDLFLGVTVPQIRLLAKKYQQMPLKEIIKMLESKFHEERMFALLIMTQQYKKGNEKTKKQIFTAYLKNTKHINNWDLVDLTAPDIVGAYLNDKSKDILFKLAQSKMLWERRIAILATFHEIKLGRSVLTFSIAEKLLGDKEDLMHKAVGWMLREIGKRCSQKKEEMFLQKYWKKMSRTTLRYAIERFDEKKRQQYLKRNV